MMTSLMLVIPREGVESHPHAENWRKAIAQPMVIPREGVERFLKLDWEDFRPSGSGDPERGS